MATSDEQHCFLVAGTPAPGLETVLDALRQGVMVTDADDVVTFLNDRFIRLYGLGSSPARAGITVRELLGHCIAAGNFPGLDLDAIWRRRSEILAARVPARRLQDLPSGRTLAISYSPLPDGGWVVLYDDATEQRSLEAELRDQTLRFDAVLDSMGQGLAVFDAASRLVTCNARYRGLFRLDEHDVVPGTPFGAIVACAARRGLHTANEADAIVSRFSGLVRDRVPARLVEPFADGRVLAVTIALLDDGGWVATFDDITEQHRSERALAEQNRRFDAALENMAHGLAVFGGDERLLVRNAKFCTLFGLDPAVVVPGVAYDAVVRHFTERQGLADEPDRTKTKWQALLRRAGRASFVQQVGGRAVLVVLNPVSGGGWIATSEDVTERLRIEGELREQNRRFDAAIGNMPVGLAMYDAELRLTVCNDRFLGIFQLDPGEVRPGMEIGRLIALTSDRVGTLAGSAPDDILVQRRAMLSAGEPVAFLHYLGDGRCVAIAMRPMPGGGWVATYEDITERRRAEQRIEHLARHDALTGLVNRATMMERVEAGLKRVSDGNGRLAVLCLDLDRFKQVNDTFGHSVGDELLRAVVQRIGNALSPGDVFARFGGDEFAIVQAAAEQPQAAESLARRIVALAAEPFLVGGREIAIGASVGIALAPEDGRTGDAMMRSADLALYAAKADGRGTWRFFLPEMDESSRNRHHLESSLRRASVEKDFELHYQPQAELGTGRIVGFEALLRWRHPERGIVGPGEFIAVAEDIGLIHALGEWVLHTACRTAASWPGRPTIAVNLSPVQFRNRRLAATVVRALAESGLQPGRLEVEITESVLLQDDDATAGALQALQALGVRLALDDFGTGFSSLSHIRTVPLDKIKIDRSFIRDITERADCVAITRAIVGLGRDLGLATTAEGVETAAQLRAVTQLGCTEGQGYLIGRPRPAHQLQPFLSAEPPSNPSVLRAGGRTRLPR